METFTLRRTVFEKLKNEGLNGEVAALRINQPLTNNSGTVVFDLKDRNSLSVNEQGLAYNDLFVATHIGIFLANEDDDRLGSEILQSYPNDQVFSGSGFTLQDLEHIYAGGLEIKQNQTVNVEKMPGFLFRKVPNAQKGSSSPSFSEFNIFDMCEALPTPLKIDGSKNVDIKFIFPTSESMKIASVTSGYTHKLVFYALGFLVKNGAKGQ